MTTPITTDVKELNRRLCNDLWNLANQKSKPSGMSPRLILPVYREDMGVRVSEQESKVLYCNLLSQTNYYFPSKHQLNKLTYKRARPDKVR